MRRLPKNSQINIDEETCIKVCRHGVVLGGRNETPDHLHKGLWDGDISQDLGNKGRALCFIGPRSVATAFSIGSQIDGPPCVPLLCMTVSGPK